MPSLLTSPAALLSLVVVLGGSVVMGREGGLLGGLFFLPVGLFAVFVVGAIGKYVMCEKKSSVTVRQEARRP